MVEKEVNSKEHNNITSMNFTNIGYE